MAAPSSFKTPELPTTSIGLMLEVAVSARDKAKLSSFGCLAYGSISTPSIFPTAESSNSIGDRALLLSFSSFAHGHISTRGDFLLTAGFSMLQALAVNLFSAPLHAHPGRKVFV